MRWAILSDIHANLEAFEAVLADAEQQGADKLAILGDTVDYGPDPVACLERAAKADVWLVGNHEEEVVASTDEAEPSPVLEWTRAQLVDHPLWHDVRAKIERDGAPAHASRVVDGGEGRANVHFFHASAARPTIQYVWPAHEVQYVVFNHHIDDRLTDFLGELAAPHGFNGHTHVPAVLTRYEHRAIFDPYQGVRRHHVHTFVGPRAIFFVPEGPCTLHEVGPVTFATNVGSVGQPRRLGDNRASYVLYDGSDLEFRRVEYAWMKTAAKLAQLPVAKRGLAARESEAADEIRDLCERLETGV